VNYINKKKKYKINNYFSFNYYFNKKIFKIYSILYIVYNIKYV